MWSEKVGYCEGGVIWYGFLTCLLAGLSIVWAVESRAVVILFDFQICSKRGFVLNKKKFVTALTLRVAVCPRNRHQKHLELFPKA